MLQPQYIVEHQSEIIDALKKRGIDATDLIEQAIFWDKKRRSLQFELDNILSESNKLSNQIGDLFKSRKLDEANKLKEKTGALKTTSKQLQEELDQSNTNLQKVLYQIPNIPHSSVPKGNSEKDNESIFEEKGSTQVGEVCLPHWELAKQYNLVDFELGNKITGAGFPIYKGRGARLQRAMISYFLDQNIAAGYTEYQPPYLVNEASGYGTGQLPDKEGQMYHIGEDNLYLIPTAEIPITNIFRDELLQEKDFPICCTAYTPCFRREAGSYGSHVRGLNRLHQFDKVEIVRIEHPEESYKALDVMVGHVQRLLQSLGLPYRILRLCGGDLGFTAALTYDFEVFSQAQERWLEVSSVSNFEAFQAHRLKLRYKNAQGQSTYAHTLNGSALALPRVLAAILENYQMPQGIYIPEVLVPYTGFDIID